MKRVILLAMIFCCVLAPVGAHAKLTVIYPNVNEVGVESFGYAALKLALDKSGVEYELKIDTAINNNARIRTQILDGVLSISDFGIGPEFEYESGLRPIYFPIDMGLNGWRVLLIHKDKQPEFTDIKTLEELKSKSLGQGIGWSDNLLWKENGFELYEAASLENLFKMTEHKRFDFFPLGVNEAGQLLESNQKFCPNVVMEKHLLVIYPWARFFYVDKENTELHDAVQTGLEKAFEDGSFLKLFKEHKSNESLFGDINLKSRTQLFMDTPILTEEFKAIPKKYFFNMDMLD